MKSSLIKEKYVNSILNKYGVNNIGKLDSSKDKVKRTNMKRYGVEYLSQLEIVKKSLSDKLKIRSKDMNDIKIENIKLNIVNKISEFGVEFIDILDSSLYLLNHDNHEFEIHKTTLNDRIKNGNTLCTVCNKIESGSDSEKKLLEFIKSIYIGEVVENSRNIISSEIDIYLPSLKIAFEYNGIFWHSDKFKDKNYHLKKTKECQEIGIKLIHIWEDDWKYKNDIVKSRISNLLNISKKIWARSCFVKEVSKSDSQVFFERNHIQGDCVSKIRIGLYHRNSLVSVMSFGSLRKSLGFQSSIGNYELLRFCNEIGCSVVGGASKIFTYFIKKYDPISVISYADRSWSSGDLYKRLGFSFEKETHPNYYWVVGGIRKNRFNYRKDALVKDGFDSSMSELEIMKSRGFNKVWDSGSLKFLWKTKSPLSL
jgi:hypothetical protein